MMRECVELSSSTSCNSEPRFLSQTQSHVLLLLSLRSAFRETRSGVKHVLRRHISGEACSRDVEAEQGTRGGSYTSSSPRQSSPYAIIGRRFFGRRCGNGEEEIRAKARISPRRGRRPRGDDRSDLATTRAPIGRVRCKMLWAAESSSARAGGRSRRRGVVHTSRHRRERRRREALLAECSRRMRRDDAVAAPPRLRSAFSGIISGTSSCAHFMCQNCTMAHQFMHCFEDQSRGAEPFSHGSSPSLSDELSHNKCQQHRSQPLLYFCLSCNLAICSDCTLVDHCSPAHEVEPIEKVAEKQTALMEQLISNARNKQQELLEMFKMVDAAQQRLTVSIHRAHQNIEDNTRTLIRIIEENRRAVMKDLDNAFGAKQLQLTVIDKKIQQMTEKLSQTIEFTQRLVKYSSPTEVMAFKHLLDSRMQVFLDYNADANNLLNTPCEVEIPVVDTTHARQMLLSLLGNIRGNAEWQIGGNGLSSGQAGMPRLPSVVLPHESDLRLPEAATTSSPPRLPSVPDSPALTPAAVFFAARTTSEAPARASDPSPTTTNPCPPPSTRYRIARFGVS
ncbi:hypothetical protein L596_018579 [Steinernema carpocapsae]|uniref:B box-type domain-containing protein n=1 Tax=Steinernema carpocapsae TaxID=34508 RepID=A0A4U5N534_STECR|nr:hypothetical protein L596_018579 [Steinernema carpocapsae]